MEDEQDTIGDDDEGPATVADTVPLDYRPHQQPPPAPPKGWADTAAIALLWLTNPTTAMGVAARLLAVAVATVAIVVIFDD
ncbi:hypothetical protein [Leptolyngbya sp. KIOST-1]|uniref:hypothetical protein n=1 Tax=Leptolyngbya sp. KIOST-1 TaxID=1229172 RepID=UPI0005625633|nr:hypothetical protein [Leptolyngbya sp. KIOST-1]